MSFFNELRKSIDEINNLQRTENGAVGYKTTGKKLLDMNFSIPKYRKASEAEIVADFKQSFSENEILAILWMFFARDVRGGLGERRLFRILFHWFCNEHSNYAKELLDCVAEYGRWDDLIRATDNTPVWDDTVALVKKQLAEDLLNHEDSKGISLLAKWLPSERTSSQKTRILARKLAKSLDINIVDYNRICVKLRKYLDVTEIKMSAKEWENINYAAVPSGANIKYNNAFLRNDEERRRAYLESLKKGETKINASTLFPHDIIHKYSKTSGWYGYVLGEYDEALEQLWKALPEMGGLENTIVVADGSGSMTTCVDPNARTTALEVANGLALYCAEHCIGEFKDKYITFSSRPQFVDLSRATTLHDKLAEAYKHDECSNTDVQAVFDLILHTAIRTNAKQEDIPKTILIVSDMEFDSATSSGWYGSRSSLTQTLFGVIEKKYKEAGYQLPRLVFWNVASRTGTIPMKENDLGVTLVSGFSTSIVQMVQNGETDPYLNLVKVITGERYIPICAKLFGDKFTKENAK